MLRRRLALLQAIDTSRFPSLAFVAIDGLIIFIGHFGFVYIYLNDAQNVYSLGYLEGDEAYRKSHNNINCRLIYFFKKNIFYKFSF